MSIRRGAFGMSGRGAFIESPKGARGWPRGAVVVLSGTGTTDRWLARLDPKTGSEIWGGYMLAASGTGAQSMAFNSAFDLFVQRPGSTGSTTLERRSIVDGLLVDAYAGGAVAQGLGAVGRDIVFSGSDLTLGLIQRRIAANLTSPYLWTYDAPNVNQGAPCNTDSAGVAYFLRINAVTSDTLPASQISRWAINADGTLLWAQMQSSPYAADGEAHQFQGQAQIAGDYIYVVTASFDIATFVSTRRVFRLNKSDGSFANTVATTYDAGDGSVAQMLFPRVANDSLYVPMRRVTILKSLARIDLDLNELATIDLGTAALSVDVLPDDSVGTGDILVMGNNSTTWPGAAGARANCWRVSADLSKIRWGVQVGDATYNGIHGISSIRYQTN